MADRGPLTLTLAEMERQQAEFDQWARGVLSGEITLDAGSPERDAQRAGFRAGRLRLDSDACAAATAGFDARELVAWSAGYGEGRALPAAKPGVQFRSVAELLGRQ